MDSKFLDDIRISSYYSRYSGYIGGWNILPKSPYYVKFIAGPAADDGVVEAYLILHLAKYIEWRNSDWPDDKVSAATDMLVVERFCPDSTISPYLRRLLSLSQVEMQEADRFASLRVADILARKEVRYCDLDKRCAADANIKRLICDIRTAKGDSLLRLEEPVCDRVSAPLVRLYSDHVGGIIKETAKSH